MAQTEIIPRRRASQVFEGTPDEIAEHLHGLNGATKLILIIPGEEMVAVPSLSPMGKKSPTLFKRSLKSLRLYRTILTRRE